MRLTLAMLAFFVGFSEICTRGSCTGRVVRPFASTPLSPSARARVNLRQAYTGYGTGINYVPGTNYGAAAYGVYPTSGGYGYANALGYNRFGFAGGPNHNVYQYANVAPYGPARRFDFTQRSIAGFFNLDDPARPFGVNFNTLRVNG
ncbi:uncharacterized protein LOC142786356 [Rhipicephalus microplus]|uniref:uncharacterized protein LOC142786356 n=1 Tax=Rhipicephalus microplus TaxID=6941 RepID=UPI003F6BE0CE